MNSLHALYASCRSELMSRRTHAAGSACLPHVVEAAVQEDADAKERESDHFAAIDGVHRVPPEHAALVS